MSAEDSANEKGNFLVPILFVIDKNEKNLGESKSHVELLGGKIKNLKYKQSYFCLFVDFSISAIFYKKYKGKLETVLYSDKALNAASTIDLYHQLLFEGSYMRFSPENYARLALSDVKPESKKRTIEDLEEKDAVKQEEDNIVSNRKKQKTSNDPKPTRTTKRRAVKKEPTPSDATVEEEPSNTTHTTTTTTTTDASTDSDKALPTNTTLDVQEKKELFTVAFILVKNGGIIKYSVPFDISFDAILMLLLSSPDLDEIKTFKLSSSLLSSPDTNVNISNWPTVKDAVKNSNTMSCTLHVY